MPVLLLTDRTSRESEGRELWLFAQTALQLCEARKASEADQMDHSSAAASSSGSLLITGPKKATLWVVAQSE